MPPKVAGKKEASKETASTANATPSTNGGNHVSQLSFKISATFRINTEAGEIALPLTLRTTCAWMDSVSVTLPAGVFTISETINCKVDKKKVNDAPGVFAYVFDKVGAILGFAYLDCSSLLVEPAVLATQGFVPPLHPLLTFDFGVSTPTTTASDIDSSEPLTLYIKSLRRFPLYPGEPQSVALQSSFLFGILHFGGVDRMVLAALPADPHAMNNSSTQPTIKLQASSTIFVGLYPAPLKIKESLRSDAQTLGVFHSSLFSAVITSETSKHANTMIMTKQFSEVDKLLISTIYATAKHFQASSICGATVLRLDALMSDAHDNLATFQSQHASTDHITAKLELSSAVTCKLPVKPQRWSRPDDISLATAIAAAGEPHTSTARPRHELYAAAGTELACSVHFLRKRNKAIPAEALADCLRFNRMVIVFSYSDETTLRKITDTLQRVNTSALPNIQGSLMSYSLTAQETLAADAGELDILSGFMVLDDDVRIVVIEGCSGTGKSMATAHAMIDRAKPNNKNFMLFYNPLVHFAARLYTRFGCDLKRIRLRGSLAKLAKKPEVSNHGIVSMDCYTAIERLSALKFVPDLQTAKQLNLFPPAEALDNIELLFGETISLQDIDGHPVESSQKDAGDATAQVTGMFADQGPGLTRDRGAVDCWNTSYEQFKAKEAACRVDFLAQHREKVEEARRQGLSLLQERLDMAAARSLEPVQRVRPHEEQQKQWMTADGFQYPKPRSTREMIRHPMRPSEARIEDLQCPYDDVLPSLEHRDERSNVLRRRERDFKLRIRGDDTFGLLRPVEFEHPFERTLVGNRASLPRGKLLAGAEKDPAFFRSIHLGGDEHAKMLAESVQRDKEHWRAKVVVDHIDFKVGGFTNKNRVIQADRAADILTGQPKRLALVMLREKRSHKGVPMGYKTAPLTLINNGPYAPNQHATVLLRETTRGERGVFESKGAGVEYKRKHLPLRYSGSHEQYSDAIDREIFQQGEGRAAAEDESYR